MSVDIATDARDKFNKVLGRATHRYGNKYITFMFKRQREILESEDISSREAAQRAYREAYLKWVEDAHQEAI